jgi:hypothetical protein
MNVLASHYRQNTATRRATWLSMSSCLLVSLSILTSGCYNGDALLEKARSAALRTRLAEIDLGTYRTTMPKNEETNSLTELELHMFGTVPRYRVPEIEQQLKAEEYRIRAEMIAAVREATVDELAEPNLTQLRARIEKVVNDILEESPVKTIGFYSLRVDYR